MMPDENWFETLEGLHARVWDRLVRGVHDRHAAARHPTLATVTPEGAPALRTVVLRGADRARAELEIHTDLHSPKIADLTATPLAALHVWEAGLHLQIRLTADVTILSGEVTRARWDRVPDPARQVYGTAPAPGTPIPDALAYAKPADPAAFAALLLQIEMIDALHLGPTHRRARFERAEGWQGRWIAP